jgi:hypothetical protein
MGVPDSGQGPEGMFHGNVRSFAGTRDTQGAQATPSRGHGVPCGPPNGGRFRRGAPPALPVTSTRSTCRSRVLPGLPESLPTSVQRPARPGTADTAPSSAPHVPGPRPVPVRPVPDAQCRRSVPDDRCRRPLPTTGAPTTAAPTTAARPPLPTTGARRRGRRPAPPQRLASRDPGPETRRVGARLAVGGALTGPSGRSHPPGTPATTPDGPPRALRPSNHGTHG